MRAWVALAAAAALLSGAGTAHACTQDEYLTPEERASGAYDNTPPPWESGSGHGTSAVTVGPQAGQQAPRERAGHGKPDAPSAEKGRGGARPIDGARRPAAPGTGRDLRGPASVPPTTADPLPAGGRAASSAPRSEPAVAGPAPRPRHEARDDSPTPHAVRALEPSEPPAEAARKRPAGGFELPRQALWALALALLVVGLGLGARLLGVRRASGASTRADPRLAVDVRDRSVEAELQELIAEERARQATGEPERV